jgi:tripartite-type tricarboxylate transporter receptor subunit TctC
MSTFQQAVIRHGIVGLIIGVTLAGSSVAMGEPVEDFYKGRQLRIVIRAGPGGNYDLYARLLVRHMVRYIPGRPAALAVNKNVGYPDVPLLRDLATNERQRIVFDYFSKMGALARPLALAAEVPPERLAALRAAFKATMEDAEFLAEAKQQNMEISMMSGEAVRQIVNDLVDVTPLFVDQIKSAILVKDAVRLEGRGAGAE